MAVDPSALAAGGKFVMDYLTGEKNAERQKQQNNLDWDRTLRLRQSDRDWALQDWNKVNAYNHPSQQMQRFREAGLNPNLIYGKGAETTASMIKNTDTKSQSQPAPIADYKGMSNAFTDYVNLTQTQAQTDNLHAQAAILKYEMLLKGIEVDDKAIDLGVKQDTYDQTVERAKIENLNRNAERFKTYAEREKIDWDREKEQDPSFYKDSPYQKKLQAEIENLQANTEHTRILKDIAKQEEKLKKYESLLRSIDINPHESNWMQLLSNKLKKLSVSEYYYGELYDIYTGKK
ncbi:MAG: DNA pilot protein [Microviridae sp.]|nr:MAG: DNA pilot protein [Microviridae sp.]